MFKKLNQKWLELFENYYYYGSAETRAKWDIAGLFIGIILGLLLFAIIVHYDLIMWLCIFLVCYGLYGMIKTFYKARVDYYNYNAQNELNIRK